VSFTVIDEDREAAEKAIEMALSELRAVEAVMSLYRPDSELSALNAYGVLRRPHPMLLEVLAKAQEFAAASDGAFDVTVQPLWRTYSAAQDLGRLPSDAEIAEARSKVDWRKLKVSAGEVRLSEHSMAVTLNGIAQGFAADRVRTTLRDAGVKHALIDTGEIGTLGSKPAEEPWRVGVQDPSENGAFLGVAALEGRCLATSGDYATRFDAGGTAHHIFDPATGRSPQEFASVSIVAPTATDADALSTAVFVLGYEKGLKLLQTSGGAEALLVFKDGSIRTTRGWPAAT